MEKTTTARKKERTNKRSSTALAVISTPVRDNDTSTEPPSETPSDMGMEVEAANASTSKKDGTEEHAPTLRNNTKEPPHHITMAPAMGRILDKMTPEAILSLLLRAADDNLIMRIIQFVAAHYWFAIVIAILITAAIVHTYHNSLHRIQGT
jgi:hypothetical protein